MSDKAFNLGGWWIANTTLEEVETFIQDARTGGEFSEKSKFILSALADELEGYVSERKVGGPKFDADVRMKLDLAYRQWCELHAAVERLHSKVGSEIESVMNCVIKNKPCGPEEIRGKLKQMVVCYNDLLSPMFEKYVSWHIPEVRNGIGEEAPKS